MLVQESVSRTELTTLALVTPVLPLTARLVWMWTSVRSSPVGTGSVATRRDLTGQIFGNLIKRLLSVLKMHLLINYHYHDYNWVNAVEVTFQAYDIL